MRGCGRPQAIVTSNNRGGRPNIRAARARVASRELMLMVRGLEELRAVVGQELGPTAWRAVAPADIEEFARAVGGSVGRGVPELYLLSLGNRFCYELIVVEPVALFLHYGYEHVRFRTVVPDRGRVRMRACVSAVAHRFGSTIVTIAQTFELQGEPEPLCVADRLLHLEWVVPGR